MQLQYHSGVAQKGHDKDTIDWIQIVMTGWKYGMKQSISLLVMTNIIRLVDQINLQREKPNPEIYQPI